MRRIGRGLTALVAAALLAASATACPVCASETGRRVRAGVFGPEFGTNLLLTALPFAVLLAAVALIHFGRPKTGPRRSP